MTDQDATLRNGIEQLGLETRSEGLGEGIRLVTECDLCGVVPDTADVEWVSPGTWRHHIRCHECERETAVEYQGVYSAGHDRSYYAEQIADRYVDGDTMSEAALDRSLARLYGVHDNE